MAAAVGGHVSPEVRTQIEAGPRIRTGSKLPVAYRLLLRQSREELIKIIEIVQSIGVEIRSGIEDQARAGRQIDERRNIAAVHGVVIVQIAEPREKRCHGVDSHIVPQRRIAERSESHDIDAMVALDHS